MQFFFLKIEPKKQKAFKQSMKENSTRLDRLKRDGGKKTNRRKNQIKIRNWQ